MQSLAAAGEGLAGATEVVATEASVEVELAEAVWGVEMAAAVRGYKRRGIQSRHRR